MKAIVIRPGEQPEVKELNGPIGVKAELNGGWLEGLTFGPDAFAYIDEEGKPKGLPRNDLATQICAEHDVGLAEDDVIMGTLIIVGTLNEHGVHDAEDHDAPDLLIEAITGKI
jgi:hypothetical protein